MIRLSVVAALLLIVCVVLSSCATRSETSPAAAVAGPAKNFVNLLANGNFSAAEEKFDAAMKQQIPVDKLKQGWQDIVSQLGGLQRQGEVRTAMEQGSRVAYVRCHFAKGDMDMKLVFDNQTKITSFMPLPVKPS